MMQLNTPDGTRKKNCLYTTYWPAQAMWTKFNRSQAPNMIILIAHVLNLHCLCCRLKDKQLAQRYMPRKIEEHDQRERKSSKEPSINGQGKYEDRR